MNNIKQEKRSSIPSQPSQKTKNEKPEKNNQKKKNSKKKKAKKNKKISQLILGGIMIALGCGCFLYPNFREWRTQKEVDEIIESFDKTYSQTMETQETECTQPVTEKEIEKSSQKEADTDSIQQTETETETETASDSDIHSFSNVSTDNMPYQSLYTKMSEYNQNLFQRGQNIFDAWDYEQQPFDLDGLGISNNNPVIGYIEIPDMKIRLPLMLGASESNLEKGAAVLSETSMPIGGKNTNCVIAGHRGWEGSAYFQYIEKMKPGSKVYITNPWQTLVYEYRETKVIYPDDVNSILIQDGKDMITLFTCHPYRMGGGPYRYLVFCERVDTQERTESDKKVLNPKTSETESETNLLESETKTVTDTATEKETAHASETQITPSQEEIDAYKKAQGIDWLILEQTLRYMLPFIVIAFSVIMILHSKWRKTKKKKKKRRKFT